MKGSSSNSPRRDGTPKLGQAGRKRQRPVMSLFGIQIRAPPEAQFTGSGSRASNTRRKVSPTTSASFSGNNAFARADTTKMTKPTTTPKSTATSEATRPEFELPKDPTKSKTRPAIDIQKGNRSRLPVSVQATGAGRSGGIAARALLTADQISHARPSTATATATATAPAFSGSQAPQHALLSAKSSQTSEKKFIAANTAMISSDDDEDASGTIQEDERDLMERLDRAVLQVEETELIQRLEIGIGVAEERELMHDLEASIVRAETDETAELARQKEHAVEVTARIRKRKERDEAEAAKQCEQNAVTYETVKKIVRSTLAEQSPSTGAEPTSSTDSHRNGDMHSLKLSLNRRTEGSANVIAFTMEEFRRSCLDVFERIQKVKSLEASLQLDPDDDSIYKITAKGDEKVLASLKMHVEAWSTYRIKMARLQNLMNDGESQVIDISVRTGVPLGISFVKTALLSTEQLVNTKQGVWFEVTVADGQVARILSQKTCEAGFALLAIQGWPCYDPSIIKTLLREKSEGRTSVNLTICLSKYTNLMGLDRSRFRVRRKDGAKHDPIYYAKLVGGPVIAPQTIKPVDIKPADKNRTGDWMEYPSSDFCYTNAAPNVPPETNIDRQDVLRKLLNNPKSVKLEIVFPASGSLGAQLFFVGGTYAGWLHGIKEDGPVFHSLGKEICFIGVGLLALNGHKVGDLKSFKQCKEEASKNATFTMTLTCFDGADLAGVDRSKLAKAPRRLNGEAYPMKLHAEDGSKMDVSDDVVSYRGKAVNSTMEKRLLGVQQDSNVHTSKSTDSNGETPLVEYSPRSEKVARDQSQLVVSNTERKTKALPSGEPINQQGIQNHISAAPPVGRAQDEANVMDLQFPADSDASVDEVDKSTARSMPVQRSAENSLGTETSVSPAVVRNPVQGYLSAIARTQKIASNPATRVAKQAAVTKYVSFEHTFDSTRPLGAYFVTDYAGKTCRVCSVWYSGQMAHEKRIRAGTIVDSVVFVRSRQRIRNHRDLLKIYEDARKKRSKLSFVFKNPEGQDAVPLNTATFDKDWSFRGDWVGAVNNGWPGGHDPRRSERDRPSTLHVFTPASNKLLEKRPIKSRDPSSTEPSILTSGTTSHTSNQQPSQSKSTPSIDQSSNAEPKKAAEKPLSISRLAVDASNDEAQVPAKEIAKVAQSLITPMEQLKAAIKHRSYSAVVRVLEDGAGTDKEVVEKGLQQCYSEVKTAIQSINKKMKSSTTSQHSTSSLSDWMKKKTLLNIYINVSHLVEKAMSLQHWACFEAKVTSAGMLFATNAGHYINLHGRLRIRVGQTYEDLGRLPIRKLTEVVNFNEDEGSANAFRFTNNAHVALERRHLNIEFDDADMDDPSISKFLCVFQIPLNQISELCPRYDVKATTKVQVSVPNPRVPKGSLEIEVSRVRVERDYIERKTQELVKEIFKQVDNIARFNKDQRAAGKSAIAPNIQGKGGVSLLHAAIHLRQKYLVQKLISIGADPCAKSEIGSPMSQAVETRDRAKEKLRKVKESGADENAIRAKRELFAEFHGIVELLGSSAF